MSTNNKRYFYIQAAKRKKLIKQAIEAESFDLLDEKIYKKEINAKSGQRFSSMQHNDTHKVANGIANKLDKILKR